jgi:hypothetical protein
MTNTGTREVFIVVPFLRAILDQITNAGKTKKGVGGHLPAARPLLGFLLSKNAPSNHVSTDRMINEQEHYRSYCSHNDAVQA